jgi:drug/metabolite transporter (DMT)-like permease
MIPSEASAAANSSFAWVYLMSLCMLNEKVDPYKVLAVVGCLGGVVLLAISGWLASLPSTHANNTGNSTGPPPPRPKFHLSVGILVEFACAILQAVYLVAFRKWALRGGRFPVRALC